jgi:hypothetical protein
MKMKMKHVTDFSRAVRTISDGKKKKKKKNAGTGRYVYMYASDPLI